MVIALVQILVAGIGNRSNGIRSNSSPTGSNGVGRDLDAGPTP